MPHSEELEQLVRYLTHGEGIFDPPDWYIPFASLQAPASRAAGLCTGVGRMGVGGVTRRGEVT